MEELILAPFKPERLDEHRAGSSEHPAGALERAVIGHLQGFCTMQLSLLVLSIRSPGNR